MRLLGSWVERARVVASIYCIYCYWVVSIGTDMCYMFLLFYIYLLQLVFCGLVLYLFGIFVGFV